MRARVVVAGAYLFVAACGRIGFDAVAGVDGTTGAVDGSAATCAATCGPMGNAPCCDSIVIPGGMFFRGHDVAADMMYAETTAPATVSTFRLDKYEVTVGRFRQFVDAGKGTQVDPPASGAGIHPAIANSGWDSSWNTSLAADTAAMRAAIKCDTMYSTWTDMPAGNESRPVTCLTWYEAMAFCAWDGGFLPTEAEWNYAAVGGSMQRAYAWSSPAGATTIDCSQATYGGTNWPTTACSPGFNTVGSTSPAGDGVWGHADLSGNAWEWGLDWYTLTAPTPCMDCANLSPATTRVVRGGGFNDPPGLQRAARRGNGTQPDVRLLDIGVRCARPP